MSNFSNKENKSVWIVDIKNGVFHIQSHHFGVFLQFQSLITVTCLSYFRLPFIDLFILEAFDIFQKSLTFILHWLQVINIFKQFNTVSIYNPIHFIVYLSCPNNIWKKRWKVFNFCNVFFSWNRINWLSRSALIFML